MAYLKAQLIPKWFVSLHIYVMFLLLLIVYLKAFFIENEGKK